MQREYYDQRSKGSFAQGEGLRSMMSMGSKRREPSVHGRQSMNILSPFMSLERRGTVVPKRRNKEPEPRIFEDDNSEDL